MMMRDALKGMVFALLASYGFAMILVLWDEQSRAGGPREIPVIAGFVMLTAVWLTLPFGAAVGVLIPRWYGRLSPRSALVRGSLAGFCAFFVAGVLFVSALELPSLFSPSTQVFDWRANVEGVLARSAILGVSMGLYSALFVGLYAYRRARRNSHP
jgi:hypothetical protein